MFKNFYTTAMSSSGKQLERRFLRLRQNSAHQWRMAAALTVLIVFFTASGSIAVIASVGGDGLEYRSKDEIYFRDGVNFTVNVAGKNLPSYVSENIAGNDGNINILLQRVEVRNVNGHVSKEHIIELSGSRGVVKMAANGNSGLHSNENNAEDIIPQYEDAYRYSSSVRFIEWNNPGYADARQRAVMSLVDPPSSDMKLVYVSFGIDNNMRIQNAFIDFFLADGNDNTSVRNFDTVAADIDSLNFIGDFAIDYPTECANDKNNFYFTFFEDDYIPSPADGIDISIETAQADGIVLNTNITNSHAAYINVNVYDSNGVIVGSYDGRQISSHITATPFSESFSYLVWGQISQLAVEEPPFHFTSGEKYRVCVVLFDDKNTVIYRWQEYVTIAQ